MAGDFILFSCFTSIKTTSPNKAFFRPLENDISKSIVNKILENLHTKKRFIPILEIEINDNGEIYDITLDRKNMLNTLQVNLKIYEKYEDYEGCDNIIKAINTISAKR